MAPNISEAPPWVPWEGGDRAGSGEENKPHSQFRHSLCLGQPWLEGQSDLHDPGLWNVKTVPNLHWKLFILGSTVTPSPPRNRRGWDPGWGIPVPSGATYGGKCAMGPE